MRRVLVVSCAAVLFCFGFGLVQADEGPFPRPSKDAIAKAEEKIRDVYKGDLAKAIKPSDKAALAATFVTAADGVGSDDASRFVLWTMAKDLAVDANDVRLAMKAVTAIVNRFQPDGPTDAKTQIERGNAAWKEAEVAPAEKRLGLKIQAAEWYLRAKPAATGVDETLIAKRLAEFGEVKPLDVNKTEEPKPSASDHVVVVAVWKYRYSDKKGVQHVDTHQYLSNGHIDSPDGTATWKKLGSTLNINNPPGGQICTLSRDGRSFEGYGKRNRKFHVSGELISGRMPE